MHEVGVVEGCCSLQDEGHPRGSHEQGPWDSGREPGRVSEAGADGGRRSEVGARELLSMRRG